MEAEITLLSDTKVGKRDFYQDHYGKLLKGIVIDVAHDPTDNAYGLVFRLPNGGIKTAWISCDEEGNGPGFLDIR